MKHFIVAILIHLFQYTNCQQSVFSVPLLPNPMAPQNSMDSTFKMPLPGEKPQPPKDTEGSAILYKGWLRYFYYMPNGEEKQPTTFEYNSAFSDQMNGNVMPSFMKDQYGYLDIPTETSFFFVLTHKTLYVLSARKNGLAKTVKSLQISWIMPSFVRQNNVLTARGGLENIGDFSEGYCFRLRLRTGIIWDMCADKSNEKMMWMNKFYPLLPQLGPNTQGMSASGSGTSSGMVSTVATKFVYNATKWFNVTDQDDKLRKKRDGKWIVIHEWSQCSKVCGGGESYQQRMCIPPVGRGRPCYGEPVLTKRCNEQPCPNTIVEDISTSGGAGGTLQDVHVTTQNAPIIKIKQLSEHYQRFTPCVVKESFRNLIQWTWIF